MRSHAMDPVDRRCASYFLSLSLSLSALSRFRARKRGRCCCRPGSPLTGYRAVATFALQGRQPRSASWWTLSASTSQPEPAPPSPLRWPQDSSSLWHPRSWWPTAASVAPARANTCCSSPTGSTRRPWLTSPLDEISRGWIELRVRQLNLTPSPWWDILGFGGGGGEGSSIGTDQVIVSHRERSLDSEHAR